MIPTIAVVLTDASKRILWVNEEFTTLTGYSLHEVIGRKPGALLQGAETEPEIILRIRKALQQQIPLKEEITNYRKSGEPYTCRLVIHPVFDRCRVLTNFIAFEADASELQDGAMVPLLELREKYRTSSLKGIEEVRLSDQLKNLLEKELLYLDPHLTLKHAADRLATNTKYLSQVVNHQAGMNFQQYINQYRVEEAKKKILDDRLGNLTLYGIALQCGFKNKSTFYKVFKELTGQTPKEFIRKQRRRVLV